MRPLQDMIAERVAVDNLGSQAPGEADREAAQLRRYLESFVWLTAFFGLG